MKKYIFIMVFILTAISMTYAAEKNRIELTDGSVLDGEIVSFSEGKYTVKSSSLGMLQIEDSKVRAIRNMDQASGSANKENVPLDAAAIQSEYQKLQPEVTGNPDIMKTITRLQSDPDFQALIKDPEVMKAAKSLDIKALTSNEKFINALNSSAVQEIKDKIKEQNDPVQNQ